MRYLIFLEKIRKAGLIQYQSCKRYLIESEDLDSFYLKDELGEINPIFKLNCNLLYILSEEE
jgi:hypothetical protein